MSWWEVRHWVRRGFVREDGEDANVKREDEGVAVEDDAWAEGGVHDWSRSSGHDEMQKGANTITYIRTPEGSLVLAIARVLIPAAVPELARSA